MSDCKECLKHIERVAFLERELADATKAGTPFWKERDTLNSYVVENARLREALQKIAEPMKYHHWEEDAYTRAACFQFVADEALKIESPRQKPCEFCHGTESIMMGSGEPMTTGYVPCQCTQQVAGAVTDSPRADVQIGTPGNSGERDSKREGGLNGKEQPATVQDRHTYGPGGPICGGPGYCMECSLEADQQKLDALMKPTAQGGSKDGDTKV